MKSQEIKAMVEHYGLMRIGDKLRITQNKDEAMGNLDAIKAAKAEIMAYLEAEAERKLAEMERKNRTFYAIPGVRALDDARIEWAEWHRKFNEAMDRGDPQIPSKPASDIKALEKNALAVWALQAKWEALHSTNYEISAIGQRAYEALRNGEDPETVKAAYDAEKAAFVERHQWD